MPKLNWGILSTAKIAVEQVIPGMLKSDKLNIVAIASRNLQKAQSVANTFDIGKAYGSYDEIIDDPDIDIIYNPLPNHLHVEWTKKAVQAGKHVLCEKPLFLNPDEADELIALSKIHQCMVGEAFMVKSHPQWSKTKELVDKGVIGELKLYHAVFSYYNTDAGNIRNISEYGGGALWDIGCYPVMTSRYIFGENPQGVLATTVLDPAFGTDVLSSAILEFPEGKRAVFSVSSQMTPYQRVQLYGTKQSLEIQIPFNAPTDRPTRIILNPGDILQEKISTETFDVYDQYQLQAEDFVSAITENNNPLNSLEDAKDHCTIINALFESAKNNQWVDLTY
ncbi:Gfo/Idh/MocA family protein [Marinoscillum sp. MHG1-6]|uniref:Gfo/Idh/MocA family protein n=1 Tax=Marinoscillum sp. MHG1-6 TaxID=2959627 RepID=UPI0021581B1B|nr:Gfo/Idh/MocA family oxidoreductase [Marinoscillum sp. MHG1-6]